MKKLKEKKNNPVLAKLRFVPLKEGLCIQTMHIGPYDQEPATVQKMKSFAEENGLKYQGRHHEIYLGDPRRTQPDKLKTIIRQPMAKTLLTP